MAEIKGAFFISFEPGRGKRLQAAAAEVGRFSVELSTSDWQLDGKEMFLIGFSTDPTNVECAAFGRHKLGPHNTAGFNVEFTAFVFFEALALSFLEGGLPSDFREAIKHIEGGRGRKFPREAWLSLLELIKKVRPKVAKEIDDLWTLVNAKDEQQPTAHVRQMALQRDAIGLSFDIAGMSDTRRQVFRRVQPVSNATQAKSFVALMNAQPPQERLLLDHDRSVFETVVAQGKYETARFSEGPRQLRVWTVDKGPIEKRAGIDLVILNQDYNSLLLLQYKCMELIYARRAEVWQYRPDGQFDRERARMKKIRKLIQHHTIPQSRMEDIRLHRGALYFKFCKRLPLSEQNGELSDGMLMSLSSMEGILKSQAAQGPKGGRVIGYDNCERYLTNSLFAALARDGWIGSQGLSDESYKQILGLVQEDDAYSMVLAESITAVPKDAPRVARRRRSRYKNPSKE